MRGYARIDFRVDKRGTPWVLEINANPCINPDDRGGFLATAKEIGLSFIDIIQKIILDAGFENFPIYKDKYEAI